MRTTLDIANDVLQAAKDRARREKKTIGEVISDLARSALTAPSQAPTPKTLCGFRPFPKRGGIVTNDLIDKLREDDVYWMRALLDVNVLIALLDADHSLHARATKWFAGHARHGWASCPITQNGCVRIMSHPGYPNALPMPAVMEHLAAASTSTFHEFWPDDVSLLDPQVADSSRIHGPRQLTDLYLLALALRNGGQFVTFDTSVSLEAIRGAEKKHMVTL